MLIRQMLGKTASLLNTRLNSSAKILFFLGQRSYAAHKNTDAEFEVWSKSLNVSDQRKMRYIRNEVD